MQYQTLPKPNGQLTFETVVPNLSSTRHVAAAAFYHCLGDTQALFFFSILPVKDKLLIDSFSFSFFFFFLKKKNSSVLATKDLIHLEQKKPYDPFTIAIV